MDLLHFPARDFPPYAEPVSPIDLQDGQVYFFLTYADPEGLCPALEPVVFIGHNLKHGDADVLYFQDLGSHLAGDRFSSLVAAEAQPGLAPRAVERACFYSGSATEAKHVFDYEHALNLLLQCSLRRASGK